MKSLADVKRRAVVGAHVTVSCEAWNWTDIPRQIVKVQTNGVWFSPLPGKDRPSYLAWPTAAFIRVDGDSFVVLDVGGEHQYDLHYRFVEEA